MTDHKQESEPQQPSVPVASPVLPDAQQPFAGQPPQGQPAPQQPPVPQQQEFDVLGLLSIVFALIIPFVGLILGIIGLVQCKKKHLPNTLSLIGVILNSVFMLIFFVWIAFVVVMALAGAGAS